jgi:excisionase family DNA binding protein
MGKTATYKSLDEIPVTMNVEDVAKSLNISRAHAYNLVNSPTFPKIRIGKRFCIPKEAFLNWMQTNLITVTN